MNVDTISIVIVGKKATVKTPDEDAVWNVKTNKDLDQLIKLVIDRYGIQCNIRINNKNTGKVNTFNNHYIRKVIYPIYKKYKRIVYRPDKLITVSVSNKDIKQDKLDRLMIQIQKARSNGNEALDDRLCKQYLKIAEL